MPDSAGYLPPVVARIVGDISDLVSKLEQAKTLLRDFTKDQYDARLGVDQTKLAADLAAARTQITRVTADTYRVRIGADTAPALADVAALKAAIDGQKANLRVGSSGGLASGALGGLFGRGGRSLLSALAWSGTGSGSGFVGRLLSPLTMFSQMFSAGFGSLGSFAGFSPEHLAMTAGGLGGLGVEGGLGAGLLGLGSAGVAGAGALADAGGMSQALGDIKNVTQAQNNLSRAIAEYGRNSTQAAHAQNLVNFALAGFSPVARQAVAQAAATGRAFKSMYDRVTGQAEKIGAQIITQATKVGEAFLPELGKAATRNTSIIQRGLQPLFAWMKRGGSNGGLGIFTNLQNIFTSHLPTTVKLFNNSLELLLRTINLIAPQTGKFVAWLGKLAANANGAGWTKYAGHVEHLIADFRILEGFFKALGHDLKSVFKNSAGEPQAIITMWTASLQKLGKWIDSINGKKQIRLLFDAHKGEIMGILHAVGALATGFGKVYLQVAPAFVTAVNRMLSVLGPFLQRLAGNPIGAWAIAIGVIGARLGVFHGLLTGLGRAFGSLAAAGGKALLGLIPRLGAAAAAMLGLSFASTEESAASGLATLAAAALNVALGIGVLGAIALLVVGIVELVKHWSTVWGAIKRITMDVVHAIVGFFTSLWHHITSIVGTVVSWVKTHWKTLGEIMMAIFLPGGVVIAAVIRFWPQISRMFSRGVADVTGFVKRLSKDVSTWFGRMYTDVSRFVSRIFTDVVRFFERMWTNVSTGVTTGIRNVVNWFKGLPGKIISAIGSLATDLYNIGVNAIEGLIHGIESAAKGVAHAVSSVVSGAVRGVKSFLGIHSPSTVFANEVGVPIAQGIAVGIGRGMPGVSGALRSLVGLASAPNLAFTAGGTASNPQLTRIENLLTQLLGEAKTTSTNTKATVDNTRQTVDAARGLSSPAGVAAQIARSNSRLVTSLRSGVASA